MCKLETWLLEDYAEGILGTAETALMDAHLRTCTDCRKELSHIKLLFWELESMRRETVVIPEAMARLENSLLDSWLSDKSESLLHKTGARVGALSREAKALVQSIPGIRAFGRAARTTASSSVKWVGKKAVKQLQVLSPFSGGED